MLGYIGLSEIIKYRKKFFHFSFLSRNLGGMEEADTPGVAPPAGVLGSVPASSCVLTPVACHSFGAFMSLLTKQSIFHSWTWSFKDSISTASWRKQDNP